YVDQAGHVRRAADDTRIALLAALGIDASGEAAAREALAAERARSATALPPVRVAGPGAARLVRLGPAWRGMRAWSLEVACESGERIRLGGRRRRGVSSLLRLPRLPLGYHRLRLVWSDGGGCVERAAEQRLIVVPAHCHSIPE